MGCSPKIARIAKIAGIAKIGRPKTFETRRNGGSGGDLEIENAKDPLCHPVTL
jgi:hypothetical protein